MMEGNNNSSFTSSETITQSSSLPEPPRYSEAPPEYSEAPPEYSEAPPEYSVVCMSHTSIPSESHVYMEQSTNYHAYPPAPQEMYNHSQPLAPVVIQQTSPPSVVIGQQINNQSVMGQFSARPIPPHKTLLQATTSRIVHTIAIGRRRNESHVTDFETGKEYIIKERTSRHGLRNKTVIKEIGGPRTIVKETPRKTVVRQRMH